MKIVHAIAFILAMIGALNWGLIGLGSMIGSNLNVVGMLLAAIGLSSLESTVYLIVGLSAVWLLVMHKKECKVCASGGMM